MPSLRRSRWFLRALSANNSKVTVGVTLTCQNKEQEAQQCAVPKIQNGTGKSRKAQIVDPVYQCIDENITSASSSCQERSPLPMIILFAQKEVDKQNRHRSAGKSHDTIAQE